MISLIDLYKSFGDLDVLRGLDLTIEKGRITVIMGGSGAGKSVLLKHMIGLMRPDRGRVVIDGRDITFLSDFYLKEIRKKFGMLFQGAALFDSMTVEENVAFPLHEHTRLSLEEIESKVRDLLERVGLVGSEDSMPADLSGGMKKRVGLARAMALDPEIVLFDEPTSGLDPIMSDRIIELIRSTQRRFEITCVIISHNVPATFKLADTIAMLHEGRITAVGAPEVIRASEDPGIQTFLAGGLGPTGAEKWWRPHGAEETQEL